MKTLLKTNGIVRAEMLEKSLRVDHDTQVQKELYMSFVTWIVLGLVAGVISNKVITRSDGGLLFDCALGVIGALTGGFLFDLAGADGITGLNIWSVFVATTGSFVLLAALHTFRRLGWTYQ